MWKTLKENDSFEISVDGEIRNAKTKMIKSLRLGARGYLRVTLYKIGDRANDKERRGKTYDIHRLMATNFIDNNENKPVVNHIDGNKLNNKVSNIEWCTVSENTQHAFDNGLGKPSKGESNGMAKISADDVRFIRQSTLKQKELGNMFGIQQTVVSRIIHRKLWKHID
jgi:hypothetical protein